MKKKVLFVILPYLRLDMKFNQVSFVAIPYGVLSLATYIKDYADIRIFDCNLHSDYCKMLSMEIEDFGPSIVGINIMFDHSYKYLPSVISAVKQKTNAMVILGGPATIYSYNKMLMENPDIDAICHGDGELPMLGLIQENGVGAKSWATKDCATPTKTLNVDLDANIDVDYSFIDPTPYFGTVVENYTIYMEDERNKVKFPCVTSRGCPYSCKFCTNSLNTDKSVRYASVDKIIEHVKRLKKEYGMTSLALHDDQLLHNHHRAKELFKKLQSYNLRIEIPNGLSPAYIDEEMADLMWRAGVDSLILALESGSKEVLRIMNKPVNPNQVRKLMKILRKYPFFIKVVLVVGMLGETDKHRQETIEFIREIKPDVISPRVASPIYGSKLREECIAKGYMRTLSTGELDINKPEINTPEYSGEYILDQVMYMNWRTNFVENYRMSIGDYKLAKHYFQYVADKYPHEAFAWYYLNQAKAKLGEVCSWEEFNKVISEKPEWVERFAEFGISI